MERDPEEGVLAYRAMIKSLVAMPGKLMFDGKDHQLFDHFAAVAQRTGIYTARTYGEIIGHLNEAWGIGAPLRLGKGSQGPGLPVSPARTLRASGRRDRQPGRLPTPGLLLMGSRSADLNGSSPIIGLRGRFTLGWFIDR